MDDPRSAGSSTSDLDLAGFAVASNGRAVSSVLPVARATARRLADDLEVSLTYIEVRDPGEGTGADGEAMAFAGELSRLRHDHLIRIHDVVPLAAEVTAPSRLVLATAVAAGGSLTELLTRRPPLSVGETLTIVVPLADAITHLHRHGVVHGALTTDAVLFTDRGMPLLADAAIDRLSCVALTTMTSSGTSAPEISEGYEATTESDAYAFASVIWTALVGSAPGWVGDRDDLSELAPHVPARVISVLTSALSAEPGERPDVADIARHLRTSVVAEPIDLAELDAGRDVPRRIRALAARQPTTHRAPRRRGVAQIVVAAAAALAVALAVVTLLLPGPLNLVDQDARASTTAVKATSEPSAPSTASTTTAPEGQSAAAPSTEQTRIGERGGQDSDEQTVIQTLVDARAAAWESADSTLLANAHGLGSAAMITDRNHLDQAMSQGSRLVDVGFVVTEVDVVERVPRSATMLGNTDEFTAKISVRRKSLTMVNPAGKRRSVAARTDVVDVTLRSEPQGWRFVSWN